MTYQQILAKLSNLHDTRKSMSYYSLYHAQYEKQAIELNAELKALTGRDYVQFTAQEIGDAHVEVALELEVLCTRSRSS